jgi:hypothetical protein
MKIDINKIKVIPNSISKKFGICVYGSPDQEVSQWIHENNFRLMMSDKFTNIIIPDDVILSDIFFDAVKYDWMDGFSPNLNKNLHIGHFSNLVLAKAFKSLGVCEKTISIYGDTLEGDVSKEDALTYLDKYQKNFNFFSDKVTMASKVKYNGDLLKDGMGDYEGTMVFEIGDEKIVGIKSNGQTSYFYQDVALAEKLNAPTLYLTGNEQSNHFNLLKKMFPHIDHVGLGLVKVGTKMSSRLGNVIFIEDFINQVKESFNNDIQLIYNVFAGFILKSNPDVDKNINLELISNPKNSSGLYLSYTMARLKSAGCEYLLYENFYSKSLEFAFLKSKINLKPNVLFEALVEHCKDINSFYSILTIKDSLKNKKFFEGMLSDLIFGCDKLGLFVINKV